MNWISDFRHHGSNSRWHAHTLDKSGANTGAITSIQADSGLAMAFRQSKCLNNILTQDYRAIIRVTVTMLGFKRLRCARILICSIETLHMIRKGQLGDIKDILASCPTLITTHFSLPKF